MKNRGAVAIRVSTLALCGALVLPALRARAQEATTPQLPAVQFGMLGAVRGQVIRLSISNTRAATELPPDPCRATLALLDAEGNALHRRDGSLVTRSVVLLPGQSAAIQVSASPFISRANLRLDFRPLALVEPVADPQAAPDTCVPSVEIIDGTSGRTLLVSQGNIRLYSGNHNETLVKDE